MTPSYEVDQRAVRFISVTSVIVAVVFSGCVYFAVQLQPVGLAWGLTLLSAAVGVLLVWHAVSDFRSSLGLHIAEDAIRGGGQTIAYERVAALEKVGFGRYRLRADDGRSVTVCTYLFEGADKLEAFLHERVPSSARSST